MTTATTRAGAKALAVVTSIATAGVLLTGCASTSANDAVKENARPPTTTTAPANPAPPKQVEPAPTPAPEELVAKEKAPAETAAQQNARRSAENYLNTMGFSRSGLIDQLKFEGYSTADATHAVDAISPNWNEQAGRVAQNYLDTMGFSRSGLIEQLKFDGFTQAQAEYGATHVGL